MGHQRSNQANPSGRSCGILDSSAVINLSNAETPSGLCSYSRVIAGLIPLTPIYIFASLTKLVGVLQAQPPIAVARANRQFIGIGTFDDRN